MPGLLSKVSSAVAACARRVSCATRRLLRARRRPRRDPTRRQLVPADDHREGSDASEEEDDDVGEGGLWSRAILMGERCKPLDFPGAIHYDSFGRRLPVAPQHPRGGGKTAAAGAAGPGALLCRSACDVDDDALAYKRGS